MWLVKIMKIAFILFKYFPFGGLQRDFFRIASVCAQRGHEIAVYTLSWQGFKPDDFNVTIVPIKSIGNHQRDKRFELWLRDHLKNHPVDITVGFNKMSQLLDIYYAADTCYEEKARTLRNWFYRQSNRYKYFYAAEHSVFASESKTEILMISAVQKPIFQRYYGTPEERFHLLPPGISKDRKAPSNALWRRLAFRRKFHLHDDDLLMLSIGSGFKTKGLDRALLAMRSLPEHILAHTHFIVIGQDNPRQFNSYAKKIGLEKYFAILAGREDILDFLLGADLLIHPAYNENTGTVLLEAMVAGLPVLATDVCGYAHYIEEAGAGLIIKSPFSQQVLNETLATMIDSKEKRRQWKRNGLKYANSADLYSMPEKAVALIERIALRKKLAKGSDSCQGMI
jgi:UDP-glucose:(heptosyl)LPS alpha-1,3-glucosyltransferase